MSPGRAVGGRRAVGRIDGGFLAPPPSLVGAAKEVAAFEATATTRLSATVGAAGAGA